MVEVPVKAMLTAPAWKVLRTMLPMNSVPTDAYKPHLSVWQQDLLKES